MGFAKETLIIRFAKIKKGFNRWFSYCRRRQIQYMEGQLIKVMKKSRIVEILDAVIYNDNNEECEVSSGCGCDLMSDVLAFTHENNVLLTGTVNQQSIRTADLMDVRLLVFVRGKEPSGDVVELANELDITLLGTGYSMFEACGRLYEAGLRGEEIENDF